MFKKCDKIFSILYLFLRIYIIHFFLCLEEKFLLPPPKEKFCMKETRNNS